ncbi:ABC transporter permease [Shewanella salipaludis]|uniref:ABC transporter permease n=1 Tax=Shewanella salipaludis TaxID=2723052 RepID=A0A972JH34_9GAMM|nr:ABC transporter permease [Shewanella salipaludis]NMH63578.1 ABC transporter permease [Shewanella salipaludis]
MFAKTVVSKAVPYALGYWQKMTIGLWLLACGCFMLADTEVIALEPWSELGHMLLGVLQPDFFATEYLLEALWQTVSFALLGVCAGLLWGAPLALVYHKPWVAAFCAFIRAIHEIFWALLFLQLFGLSPVTGILAIALPFGATFARVFHDIISLAPADTGQNLPAGTDMLSRYVFGRIVHVSGQLQAYIRYRFECALRSSAVLGFVGMPTLGFYLESAFKQGQYHQGGALLILFVLLIGSISYWCRARLLPLYLLLALVFLPELPAIDGHLIWRFLSQDIWPPMLQGVSHLEQLDLQRLNALGSWLFTLLEKQALPGIFATLILALVALAMTHVLTLLWLPLVSRKLRGKWTVFGGKAMLLVLRSLPEYLLAFVLMLLLGPSMLPAMLALALHNAALLIFLTTRQSDKLVVSAQFSPKLDNYFYEILPRLYPGVMALLFYRFEVILRETAIFGMLGIATLGFYIDSQFVEIRFAGALVLMCFTAMMNIGVDALGRKILKGQKVPLLGC